MTYVPQEVADSFHTDADDFCDALHDWLVDVPVAEQDTGQSISLAVLAVAEQIRKLRYELKNHRE